MLNMFENLKKALPYFLLSFALFSVIGFYSGWDARKETTINKLYATIQGDQDEGGYFLVHECKKKWTHRFYVQENRIKRDVSVSATHAQAFRHGPPSERHLKHRDIIISLLGGVSGGISYKDIKKSLNTGVSKKTYAIKIIAGIIGGVSGYALGYWTGSHYDTDCDSSLANEILSDVQAWRQIETEWIYFGISETRHGDNPRFWKYTGKNLDPLQDDPVVLCNTSINRGLRNLQSEAEIIDKDFGARHFELLYNLTKQYNAIKNTREYQAILTMNKGKLIGDKNRALAKHYGFSPENWHKGCASLEALIQNIVSF